ncbi:MAG: putative colanic acid biosynthesis acetyltransferase [Phycisphaera sp.]|nr:MAG: putative colanic acid biosynthesis acetyltransferase [Phycisphaera sp.]
MNTESPRAEDRSVSPYSTKEKVGRILWAIVQSTLFRSSFHNWYGWRRFLLMRFGAKLDPIVRIRRTVTIECPWNLAMGNESSAGDGVKLYCLGPVTIGNRVSISQFAHVCAGSHDHTRPDLPLTRPPITIEDDAWIAADAFVGPGITVGAGAILGARGCAFKDLEPWTIYGGNPAKAIAERSPFETTESNAK